MLTANSLRLHDHQGIPNARRNPIEAGKNQTIEIAEGEPLRRFSSQHIELMAQGQAASSETLDRNSLMTAHQISLSISPIGGRRTRSKACFHGSSQDGEDEGISFLGDRQTDGVQAYLGHLENLAVSDSSTVSRSSASVRDAVKDLLRSVGLK